MDRIQLVNFFCRLSFFEKFNNFICFVFKGSTSNREAELAMWKRRASYDPMKAAAEGKKKQDEARKALQSSKYNDR